MGLDLYDHQLEAIKELRTGSILRGGVGSGKSRTSLAYYYENESDKDLYIITTARKRDTKDWEEEIEVFEKETNLVVDSWNNIKKYIEVENAFFIFDEQRVVGYGTWVKAFIKITRKNPWILLSATPGDVWLDYLPVFIANNFYKNKTEFIRMHVVYNSYSKYPKIDRYVNVKRLERFKQAITVVMKFERHTIQNHKTLFVNYDEHKFALIKDKRWNVFEGKPIKDIAETYRLMRKLVNGDERRVLAVKVLSEEHDKMIIFYNFNYELDLLRQMATELNIEYAEWNGHYHQPIPKKDKWLYLVQYTAGAEGWNCIETDTVVFYSQNYSYKIMSQAAGRIDRLNTKYVDLYYYHLMTKSFIDFSINRALKSKKNFQEKDF